MHALHAGRGAPPPGNDEARTTVAAVPGPKDHSTEDISIIAQRPEDAKRCAILAAQYALAGHVLIKSQTGEGPAPYYATRWGLIRPLDDLDAAEAWLGEVTGARS